MICERLLMCDIWEWFEGLLLICWCCIMTILLWIVPCYANDHLLIICVNMSFTFFWDMVVTSVMCIEKESEIKRGCTILWDVSRAAMNTIFWGTYRTPRCILYFEGHRTPWWLLLLRVISHAAMNAQTNVSSMGPILRDNGYWSLNRTCITILDIEFHCIIHLYHWWTWSCVLWILFVSFCGIYDWCTLSFLLGYTIS